MLRRAIATATALLALTASIVPAQSAGGTFNDQRMTVLRVDPERGRLMCAEHHRWLSVAKGNPQGAKPGDIVRVDRTNGGAARVRLLRTAADEIASPE